MTKRDAMRDLEICNDATPGPWECYHDDGDWGAGIISEETDDVVATTRQLRLGSQFIRDAVFIAKAREALPYYIQLSQELKVERDEAWAEVAKLRKRLAYFDDRPPMCSGVGIVQVPE